MRNNAQFNNPESLDLVIKLLPYYDDFFELDETSHLILKTIAKYGHLSINAISKKSSKYLTRETVRRRIEGKDAPILSLQNNEFVHIKKRKGRNGSLCSLTFKGFLATLNSIKFDQHYLVKNYNDFLLHYFSDKILVKLINLLQKQNLAFFLIYHLDNNYNFHRQYDFSDYFYKWNFSNSYYDIEYLHPKLRNKNYEQLLISIRKDFIVLNHMLTKYLTNNFKTKKNIRNYNDFLIGVVQGWPIALEYLQFENFESFDPKYPSYGPESILEYSDFNQISVRNEINKFSKQFRFKKIHQNKQIQSIFKLKEPIHY